MDPGAAHKAASEGRFAACAVEGGPGNTPMAIGALYLDPCPAAESENQARIVNCLAWARSLGHGSWAIGGDWNRAPATMNAELETIQ